MAKTNSKPKSPKNGFTDPFLKNLKPILGGRFELVDNGCKGLRLRVTSGGTKTFLWYYRDPDTGKTARHNIGPYPGTSLAHGGNC